MKQSQRFVIFLVTILMAFAGIIPLVAIALGAVQSGSPLALDGSFFNLPDQLRPQQTNWCVAGSFQGWNNTSHVMHDDGLQGDIIPGDHVYSLTVSPAEPGRHEFKVVACGNWNIAYPAANSWFHTEGAGQSVVISFDNAGSTSIQATDAVPLQGWVPGQNIVSVRHDSHVDAFTAVGDFQGWNNGDPNTSMIPLGYGRYYAAITMANAGDYIGKVVHTGSWEGFGADGRSVDAPNIQFSTSEANQTVYFLLDLFYEQVQIRPQQPPRMDSWCAAGSFQGWNNTSHPLNDAGSDGDLLAGDGVYSLDVVIASADRYEFKIVECGNWGNAFPAANAWFYTAETDQVVKLVFDSNTYDLGLQAVNQGTFLPNGNIVNVMGDSQLDSLTMVGDFQGWNNADPATTMTDLGEGRFAGHVTIAQAGSYIGKVVKTGSWDGISSDGRSVDAPNIAFSTSQADQQVFFFVDLARGQIAHWVPGAEPPPPTPTPTVTPTPPPGGGPDYALFHYQRPADDYDGWGLHLWGDAIAPEEGTTWTEPKEFSGFDDYGAYVAIRLADASKPVNFIIHKGNDKDTPNDRNFNPQNTPVVWTVQGDPDHYGSRAEATSMAVVHYHRPGNDYDGWGLHLWGDGLAPGEGTDWSNPKLPAGFDAFGATFEIALADATQPVNFIVHKGDEKDTDADRSFVPASNYAIWLQSGDATVHEQQAAADNVAIIHYRRPLGDYEGWGLHLWEDSAEEGVTWTNPLPPAGEDDFGVYWRVRLKDDPQRIGYIIHKGDEKDPGPDEFMVFSEVGHEIWKTQGSLTQFSHPAIALAELNRQEVGDLSKQQAYWVSEDTIAWPAATAMTNRYYLYLAPNGGLTIEDMKADVTTDIGVWELTIDPAGLPASVLAKFPHLAGMPALKIGSTQVDGVPEALKSQFAVAMKDPSGTLLDASGLQIPGVLDDLYTYDGDLGIIWENSIPTLRLWAPTAQSVHLHLFPDSGQTHSSTRAEMAYDAETGVWSIQGDATWLWQYYLYEVKVFAPSQGAIVTNLVTDPYSLSLNTNSQRSQIVNLDHQRLAPTGWMNLVKPPLVAPEDISIYELHVRDFSINDPTVPDHLKGTFQALTLEDSNGIRHLRALEEAGLTHLHLLPVFDIATIDERKSFWQNPDPVILAGYPPASSRQQEIVTSVEDLDGFNWGYDPYHYTVPEGSYSTNPNGPTRIVEFREMVSALNRMGLRVVMDVVYNHTNAAGQNQKSVLDRIVPGYYHRLNSNGGVESQSCCPDTAAEHAMMEKLMIDSLLTWAKYYKVDGFRFDLMGMHPLSSMQKVRAALDGLTLDQDGVDGKRIYIYGEGWDMVSKDRGDWATQLNLNGSGIGSFSDRLRDAVRGAGPFDSGQGLRKQGFADGLYYDPNDSAQGSPQQQLQRLLLLTDQIRVNMAGNLADYHFVDRTGTVVRGADVDYNGNPAGYTADPSEDITYVSKHDNQTLYDIYVYSLPTATSMNDRVRVQNIALSTVMLGQGIPFLHAGSDLLRSKSLDRDSYNSGDWFNRLDFSYQQNNFGVGLPVASKNSENWDIMRPLLADRSLQPRPQHIMHSRDLFQELLQLRYSSPLFRLRTAQEIQARVQYHNTGPDQVPGLIVMTVSDWRQPDLDPAYEMVVVLINANDEEQSFDSALDGRRLILHPLQQASVDPVVSTSSYDPGNGTFTIPARTAAVFVEPQLGEDAFITFPGDYVSAIGGNDWDPGDATTRATDGNGDSVWKFSLSTPISGTHAFKATVGGSWDENYGRNGIAGGENVTFTSADGLVHFYYDRSDNYVTSRPDSRIPVLVGDFLSMFGGSNWAPDNLVGWMKDKDGDGLYTITLPMPAGVYEYKVALDESWDENYGQDSQPGGANVVLTVPEGGEEVTFYFDANRKQIGDTITNPPGVHTTYLPVTWLNSPYHPTPEEEDLVRPVVTYGVQDDTFYFVMPDRFADGDPANNVGDDPGGETEADVLRHGYLPANKGYYHGGDLGGLTSKLDYLTDMGITALWVTPVFGNRPVQGDGTIAGSSAGYHGYWIRDFTSADAHLGTDAELQALVDAAHARDMKVYFDLVVNHTADYITYEEGQFSYRNKTDYPYKDAQGNVFDDADYAGTSTFPDLDAATSFPYTPVFANPADASAKAPDWLNNPIYYHNRGESTFRGENSLYGDFYGLDDTFTEHPWVVQGFIDIARSWIEEFDIDGLRLDTVKHVNIEFWQQFAPAVLDYAHAVGKNDFYMFGEVFGEDPEYRSRYTKAGSLPSVVDFGLHGQALAFAAQSASTDSLRDFFMSDDHYTDADSNAYGLGNFVSNHDVGRLGRELRNQNAGATDAELVARSQLGYSLIYFTRGFPIVYYGDEQGFTGDGGDKDAREDMFPSVVPEYNDNDLIGTDATTADDNFDASHPLYQSLADLASLRHAHPALSRGAQIHRASSDGAGIYAFSRIDRQEQVEYIVALNNAETPQSATFRTYSPATDFSVITEVGDPVLSSDADGSLTVTVPPLTTVIYRATQALPASTAAPAVRLATPVKDAEVYGNVEIKADVGGNQYVEVTFAVSVGADAEFEVIGTDDNPPYRVFYDVSTLPIGTPLTLKALVSDLHGHLTADELQVTVVEEPKPVEDQGYAILHYMREDGDYGDHTTGDYNDYWGLHLWGDGLQSGEGTEWTSPRPFLGADAYGRFAWVGLSDPEANVNFIVHRGDVKDGTDADRGFNPLSDGREIWLKGNDGAFYTSAAAALGYATLHYTRPGGDYDGWGLHLWGDGLDPSEITDWTSPKLPTGSDEFGVTFDIRLVDPTQPVNFIIHKGDEKDTPNDRSIIPAQAQQVWLQQDDETIYTQPGAIEGYALLHYHRPGGDYGDYTSDSSADFWGLHLWGDTTESVAWTSPLKPIAADSFGQIFRIGLTDAASEIGYILHRGDAKDPGPDQFLDFAQNGYEVWQLEGAEPLKPYVLPLP